MTLTLNKKEIIEQFLNPLNRVSSECSLAVNSESISTLVNDNTGTIILYSKIKIKTGLLDNEKVNLNFKDLRKLIKIFECIQDENFEIKTDDDAKVISHKSPTLSFKLYLVADNVIKKCEANLEKISKLSFDSDFELTCDKAREIIKGSISTSNAEKVYFYTKDGAVYAELTDKATQEVDSITFNISDKYNGSDITTPLPFNMEILRLINSGKYDKMTVKINNTYKILLFEICDAKIMFKYIIPAFTK
ncbi:MAG: hypothetical protein PHS54_00510 [Clostridia bacterium]|nr:hypothetical protein [Clostridia bacterium]